MRYGYACISMKLSYPQKYGGKEKGIKPITTGRTMIRRTFDTKGVDYASELTLQKRHNNSLTRFPRTQSRVSS